MPSATTVRETGQELVRFLLSRIEEDERALKRLARHRHDFDEEPEVRALDRLVSEAAAKRRLIGCLQQLLVLRDQPAEKAVRDQASQMLRVMALPYHGHSGYHTEWRPSGSH